MDHDSLPEPLRFVELYKEYGDEVKAAKMMGFDLDESSEDRAKRLMKNEHVKLLLETDEVLEDSDPVDKVEGLPGPKEALLELVGIYNRAESPKDQLAALTMYMKATGMMEERIKITKEVKATDLDFSVYTEEELGQLEALLSKGSRDPS